MALVRAFTEIAKNGRQHDEVECTFTVIRERGNTLLQLDTYGRADRQERGKVSQSLQLDEDGARALAALISQTFGF